MVLGRLIDRLPTTLRVILIRWFIYVFAALPGLMALRGQLDEAVGKRPWFQDAEMPLDMLNVTLVAAELSDGAGLLMLCALLAWFLQLIWLAGAVRVLDPNAESRKVLASGRPFLWRYLRIAFFALLAILVVHVGTKAVFESLATSAELQGKPLDVSIFDLNMWRGAILFFLFTLIGVFVFWARVITAATDEHKLRRVPRKILRVFRRHIGSALLLQFLAVTVVLALQAVALYAWRQAGGGTAWYLAWLLLLLVAAWVWQWRVSFALRLAKG
jgi:hypothetical protein